MIYGQIKKCFYVLLSSALVLRTAENLLTTDGKTGFVKSGLGVINAVLTVLPLICVAVLAFLSVRVKYLPKKIAGPDLLSSASALFIAIFTVIDTFTVNSPESYPAWQIAIITVVGILNAVYFLLYAASLVINLPPLLSIIPLVFSIVRLVRFFAATSSITLITSNIFATFAYSACVIFMLEFASAQNGIGTKKIYRKFIAAGLCACVLCLISAVPDILKLIFDKTAVAHESVASVIQTAAMGVFCFAVTNRTFSVGRPHK